MLLLLVSWRGPLCWEPVSLASARRGWRCHGSFDSSGGLGVGCTRCVCGHPFWARVPKGMVGDLGAGFPRMVENWRWI